MRRLYYPVKVFKVILKNGEEYMAKTIYNMRYSEPKDELDGVYTKSEIQDFISKYGWCAYQDYTWRFKKYIIFSGYTRKLIIEEIDKIEVSMTHRDVKSYQTIKSISEELNYEEFLQFVFDKEQELKSVITNIGGKS